MRARGKKFIDPSEMDILLTGEKKTLDFKNFFPPERSHLPMELEIGSGDGSFIIRQSAKVPDVNYIGVELSVPYCYKTIRKIRENNIKNVRMVRGNAEMFIKEYTGNEVFSQIHIYYPDPWPKRRHNNRRLIKESFLRELHRVLRPSGLIRMASDHEDYLQWMEKHAGLVSDIFEKIPFIPPEAASEDELVGTVYEYKFKDKSNHGGLILKKREVKKSER